MADAVTSTKMQDGPRDLVYRFTNISDGTGEADVLKVDISTLSTDRGRVPTHLAIERIWWICAGMDVRILFDATTNDHALTLSGDNMFDFRSVGPIVDPESTGSTGDILFTTVGATAGDSYSVVIQFAKRYD